MAKKKAKKKAAKAVAKEAPVVEEKPGEEVVSEPAHVPEPIVTVRGTAVGGTRQMTQSEYNKYIQANK